MRPSRGQLGKADGVSVPQDCPFVPVSKGILGQENRQDRETVDAQMRRRGNAIRIQQRREKVRRQHETVYKQQN